MPEDGALARIEKRMDLVVRLLAARLIDGKSKNEAILILGRLGLDYDTVASLSGTTRNAVRARLSEIRRSKQNRNRGALANGSAKRRVAR